MDVSSVNKQTTMLTPTGMAQPKDAKPASQVVPRWQVSRLVADQPAANLFALNSGTGQSLVEFALVLMFVILPFTFVLVDGAMVLFTLVNVTNAAREGARGGSIYQTTTPPSASQTFADQVAAIDAARLAYVQQTVQERLGPLVAVSQCTTTITYRPATPGLGNPYRALDDVTLRLACPRRLLFGLVDAGSVTLTSEATMRIEPGGVAPQP